MTREDKTMIMKRPDGLIVSEYCDGTRITLRPLGGGSNTIIMEHPLFARVTYNTRDSCTLDLPSNTQITCSPLGKYTITERGQTSLNISSNGKLIYKNCNIQNSSYTLSHTSEEHILKGKDHVGQRYSVSFDDGISISKKTDKGFQSPCDRFLPKVFVFNRNGDGFQLCNKRDVDRFVTNSTKNGNIVTRDKLPQCPQIDTITAISTDVNYCNEALLPYADGNIVPKNLKRCDTNGQRELHKEKKRRFGVGVGKGLSVGTYTPPLSTKVFKKPKTLKYRQFIDFTDCGLKESLHTCLAQYIQWKDDNADNEDRLLPDTMEECLKEGKDLLRDVLVLKNMASPEELLELYQAEWEKENTAPTQEPLEPKKKTKVVIDETDKQEEDESMTTETAIDEPSLNIAELASNLPMNQIKRKSLVSFNLPDTKHHLLSSHTEETGLQSDRSTPVTNTSMTLGLSDMEMSFSSETESLQPSQQMATSLLTPCRSEDPSSPMPRPNNPTPYQAANNQSRVLITSTPIEGRGEEDMDKGLTPSAPTPIPTHSLEYCASGDLRHYPIKLPRSISGGKPGEIVNEKVCVLPTCNLIPLHADTLI